MPILSKGRKPKRDALLEELAKEDLQVLSLAYVYAKNLQLYGEDVTKAIDTATQNVAILEKAYNKGYYDAMNKVLSESEDRDDRLSEIHKRFKKMC